MEYKKAQSEVITIVLIILLVLVAIIIVWQVVTTSVNKSAKEAKGTSDCVTLEIEMLDVTNATNNNIRLRMGSAPGNLVGLRIYFGNRTSGQYDYIETLDLMKNPIDILQEKNFNITNRLINGNASAIGKYVKIAKIVGNNIENGKVCDYSGVSADNGLAITAG